MQGPLTQWVTDHRKHHALSDLPGDPHSPHAGRGMSLWQRARGLCALARRLALLRRRGSSAGREYGKDLYDDNDDPLIDRLYLVWVVLTVGPAVPGSATPSLGRWQGGLQAMIWGGLIRIFLFPARDLLRSTRSATCSASRPRSRPATRAATCGSSHCPSFGESVAQRPSRVSRSSAVHGLRAGADRPFCGNRSAGSRSSALVLDVKRPDPRQVERRKAEPV